MIVGKTTTQEFAIGKPGPVKAVSDSAQSVGPDEVEWGSSAGSANGVAAAMFLAAVGTDTGGSIRLPAAFCGITGIVPTYSLVPKAGCVQLGFSLDRVGPLARTARDCGLIMQVLAGHHGSDHTSSHRPVPDLLQGALHSLDGVRVGVAREPMLAGADATVVRAFDEAIDAFAACGAVVRDVTLPLYAEMVAVMVLARATEAVAYHRRDLQSRWAEYTQGTRETLGWGAIVAGPDYV